ncbi:MAG: membrane protein insertase YidC [bacterium]|nr:membrane protein insertase YidC [bacterium]
METKRLILAGGLSIVVILLYQYLFMPQPKPQPQAKTQQVEGQQTAGEQQQGQTPTTTTGGEETGQTGDTGGSTNISLKTKKKKKPTVVEETPQVAVEESITDDSEKDIVVQTDLFRAVFTNKGAGLKSFILSRYEDDLKQPMEMISDKVNITFDQTHFYPFYLSPFEDDSEILWEINNKNFLYKGEQTVTLSGSLEPVKTLLFEYADVEKKLKVVKRFTITNNSYVIGIDYDVVIDGENMDVPIIFGPDLENNVSKDRVMQSTLRVASFDGEDVNEKIFAGIDTGGGQQAVQEIGGTMVNAYYWAVYDTNYFAAIFKTGEKFKNIRYHIIKNQSDPKNVKLFSYILVTKPESVYMGPKDEPTLNLIEANYDYREANKVVDYGWSFFGAIAKLLLKGILFFHGIIPNMGWALVLFTIFIKILLFPLTYASSVSMAKMQTLQPKLKAIKKKYKNVKDPEQRKQMNIETMALYKSEKVNPAGGCLPMLLQMPILFAFFRLLPISISFRHEPWVLWITDLSVKDPIYLIPILMGVTQIMVSKMSPTSMEASQKKIMYIMPVVMVFLFMSYSAGLTLYWFISNLLQMVQQHYINKKIFKEKKDEDKQKKAQKRKKGGKQR